MTVESSSRRTTYAGGQSTLTFSFRALVSHPEYIKVVKTLISTGVETELTYSSDYTVALNANGVGGVVTVSPTISTSYTMTVYRDTTDLQESDYDDYNQFPADTLEDDLDRRTLISQERSDDVSRVPTLPISFTGNTVSLPNPVDGYSLIWSGGNLVNSSLTGSTGAIGPSGATGTVLRAQCINFTRSMTATTGTVAYTGVGFTPKAIFVIGAIASDSALVTLGFAAGASTNAGVVNTDNFDSTKWTTGQTLISASNGVGTSQNAVLSSFDSDGFTLSWTRTGVTSSGTLTLQAICMG